MSYKGEMSLAMEMLASDPRTVFIGQATACRGTSMSTTFDNVPLERRIEFPVAEEMQLGVSIGLALSGYIPVTLFTRWNFLILAANQLVNHLDKMVEYRPKVIIRTGVGSENPMYPGPQHTGDFTDAFASICPSVEFVKLNQSADIVPAYRKALESQSSTVLVEISDKYNE